MSEGPSKAELKAEEEPIFPEPFGSLLEDLRRRLENVPAQGVCSSCGRPVKVTSFTSRVDPHRSTAVLEYEYGHRASPPLGRVEVRVQFYGCRPPNRPARLPLLPWRR